MLGDDLTSSSSCAGVRDVLGLSEEEALSSANPNGFLTPVVAGLVIDENEGLPKAGLPLDSESLR